MPYALIVDDDVDFMPALSQIVQQQGYHVRIAKSQEEARQELQRGIPDVALIDLLLPDGDGIQLVRDLTLTGSTKVLIITGYAGVESAVAALRAGVTEFMQKPFDVGQLRRQLQLIKDEFDNRLPVETGQLFDENGLGDIVGRSPQMHTVYNLVKKVAPTETTVFIYGESGTGKELVAHAVHALSTRRDTPFVALNCAAVPPHLIATEYFGHEKGAFTDAHSLHKGCIARVGGSQEIPIDIRIITATNRAPQQAVEDGKLREDLLFRLMTFPIYLPPLRERQGDILHLANTFLGQLNRREGTGKTFSKDAVDFLATSVWPGNVRELKNSVQYAYIVSGEQIEARHFPPASSSIAEESLSPLRFTLGTSLYDFENRFILATLDHYNGDKRSAAEALGVSLKTLYNRLNNYQSPA